MQGFACSGKLIHRIHQYGVIEKITLGDGLIDSRQLLIYDSAGAKGHVAHFGIAHLSRRQSDVFT